MKLIHTIAGAVASICLSLLCGTASGQPTFAIPLNQPSTLGGIVDVPVLVTDSAFGIASARFNIQYDTTRLDLSSTDVTLSSYLQGVGGWSVFSNIHDNTGSAVIVISSATGLSTTSPQQLLDLNFHVPLAAPVGTAAINILTSPTGTSNWGDQSGNVNPILSPNNGTVLVPVGSGTWRNGAADNLWTTFTSADHNWATAIPLAINNIATFDDTVIGGVGTVNLNGSKTIGGVVLNTSTAGYTLGSVSTTDTLTLQVSSGAGSISATGDGILGHNPLHTINAKVITASNTNISVSGGAALSLAGGLDNSAGKTVALTQSGAGTLSAGAVINNGILAVQGTVAAGAFSGTGTTNVGPTSNGSLTATRIVQGTLNVSRNPTTADPTPNATVTITASSPSSYSAPGNSIVPKGNSSGTSILNTLSIANNGAGLVPSPSGPSTYYGTVDLMNNNMVIDYTGHASPVASIRDALWSAYNGGSWTGNGLTSSFIAANPGAQYAVGFSDNASGGNHSGPFDNGTHPFEGTPVNSQTILLKFTWQDDLNLDGTVDISDAQIFADSYDNGGSTGHTFVQGDLNYDGIVDISDAQIFANGYIIAPQLATLPEPSSFVLSAIGIAGLLFLRRRAVGREKAVT